MEIVFIRHGESEGNLINKTEPFLCGRWDCELTGKGIRQAELLRGNALLEDADAVFVSPLKRTIHTADIIVSHPYTINERLMERTMGEFDGRYISELRNISEYDKYFSNPDFMNFRLSFTQKAPGGENYSDVEARARDFWNDISDRGYKKIVLVSHSVFFRCFVKVIEGLSEEECFKLDIKQCEPVILHA